MRGPVGVVDVAGRYKAYPVYKDSGVDWLKDVPHHWVVASLKRFIQMQYGDALPSDIRECGEIPVYGSNGIVGTHNASNALCPSIIVGRKGSFGKISYANTISYCIDTAYYIDKRHYSGEINYLYYLLQAINLDDVTLDTGVPGLSRESAYNKVAAWPNKDEQASIAAFLDHETTKIDHLIAKQEQLIALLKEKRQAVISHAVTKGLNPGAPMKDSGVEWLGEVPEHWEVGKFKHFWNVTDCKHITAEFVDEGFPLASIREVHEKYVNLDEAKQTNEEYYRLMISGGRKPKFGDIIYSRNATVGEASIVSTTQKFALGQDVCLLRSSMHDPEYCYFLLQSCLIMEQLESIMVGATFNRVNVEDVKNYVVAFPSKQEQHEISGKLNSITCSFEEAMLKSTQIIARLQEHRSSLITAAVTGKIDVRGFKPEASPA